MKTIIFSIALLFFAKHDFYTSVTQIDYNKKAQTLEITVRLFTDDLIVALEQNGAPKMELGTDNEPPEANEFLEKYLRKHLLLTVNGKPSPFKYHGKEAQLDATWCYLEITDILSVSKLELKNTLLLSSFENQTNMVNLSIDGGTKSGLTRKGSTELDFEF